MIVTLFGGGGFGCQPRFDGPVLQEAGGFLGYSHCSEHKDSQQRISDSRTHPQPEENPKRNRQGQGIRQHVNQRLRYGVDLPADALR